MQRASHFFQEGNWTETPEDYILQVIFFICAQLHIQLVLFFHIFNISHFRDGVSEGQFYQVLFYELDAIRKVILIYLLFFSP